MSRKPSLATIPPGSPTASERSFVIGGSLFEDNEIEEFTPPDRSKYKRKIHEDSAGTTESGKEPEGAGDAEGKTPMKSKAVKTLREVEGPVSDQFCGLCKR